MGDSGSALWHVPGSVWGNRLPTHNLRCRATSKKFGEPPRQAAATAVPIMKGPVMKVRNTGRMALAMVITIMVARFGDIR